jgi:uracil-DNA glycosylase
MTDLQTTDLFPAFDKLQLLHGDSNLHAIYGGGCTKIPSICLVFMNPTARNVAAQKDWTGIRAPWLGTKLVWKLIQAIGGISEETYAIIRKKKPQEWDNSFAENVYNELARNHFYLTNLAKCTQIDARPLNDVVFKQYTDLFWQEMGSINPERIITLGTQVSYHILDKRIQLEKSAGKPHQVLHNGSIFTVIPTYYPVGQGTRNMPRTISSIKPYLIKI